MKSFNFDQTYPNIGSKTQNVEELSLDLIFHNNFWQHVKNFCKQNSKLRVYSRPDRNQSKLSVCSASATNEPHTRAQKNTYRSWRLKRATPLLCIHRKTYMLYLAFYLHWKLVVHSRFASGDLPFFK